MSSVAFQPSDFIIIITVNTRAKKTGLHQESTPFVPVLRSRFLVTNIQSSEVHKSSSIRFLNLLRGLPLGLLHIGFQSKSYLWDLFPSFSTTCLTHLNPFILNYSDNIGLAIQILITAACVPVPFSSTRIWSHFLYIHISQYSSLKAFQMFITFVSDQVS